MRHQEARDGKINPCANKRWKKAMKAYWKWEAFDSPLSSSIREERLYQSAMELCKRSGVDSAERLALLVKHGVSTGFPYGKKGHSLKMYESGWWKPATTWQWRLSNSALREPGDYWLVRPNIRRIRPSLNPERLP